MSEPTSAGEGKSHAPLHATSASSQNDLLADLVTKVAVDRDREAFIALYDYYAPRLNAYLLRLGTENGVAEELAQEVMVTLWRKAELFDRTKSSVGTWLFRIARNRRIDMIRRDKSASIDQNDPIFLPSEAESAGEMMDQTRREERVRLALKSLPDEQRILVERAFFLSESHSQIAEMTGLPLGTVKSRIRLAFARLKKLLEADPEVDID